MSARVPGTGKPSKTIPSEAGFVMAELTRWDQSFCRSPWLSGVVPALALLLCRLSLACAHTGPPALILDDHMIGPYRTSIWADPEVGSGKFFIQLEPSPGGNMATNVTVQLGIQPLSGRLAEVRYPVRRQEVGGRVQYQADVPFDAPELWRVRFIIQGSDGGGETTVDLEATPPGFGHWDVLLYLFPFLAVGLLGLRVVVYRAWHRGDTL
jgi:hypothetical protein